MIFILLIIGVCFGYALESICYKYFEKNRNSTLLLGVTMMSFIAYLITAGVFAIVDLSSLIQNITFLNVLVMCINAIIVLMQMVLWVKALKNIKMSIADPIVNLQLIVMAISSYLIFGDALTKLEITLLVTIFIFVILLGIEQGKQEKTQKVEGKSVFKGLMFMVAWVFFSSFRTLLSKAVATTEMHPVTMQLFFYFFAFLLATIIFVWTNRKGEAKKQLSIIYHTKWYYFIPIANVVTGILFIVLIKSYNIGLIQALTNVYSVLVIMYGKFVFKEKITWKTYMILALIVACSATLSLIAA